MAGPFSYRSSPFASGGSYGLANPSRAPGRRYKWLPLDVVERWEPLAKQLGVSEVARSKRGFLTQYRAAGGNWQALEPYWQRRRDNFVARHLGQQKAHGEPLFDADGQPTRRHLALIMWAYSPHATRL